MKHSHIISTQTTSGYSRPVSRHQNPAAHGGITLRQQCECGASRLVNVNQRHREVGGWRKPTVA